MLFILFLFAFAQSTIWSDLGCSDEGFLSASPLRKLLDNSNEEIVSKFLQSSHPLAQSSCHGSHVIEDPIPANQFHLFWECHNNQDKSCLLPSVNVRTLKTLLHYHPTSKVTVWSNSLQKSLLKTRISDPNLDLRRYSRRLFTSLPPAATQAFDDIPHFFESNVESQSHFSDLFRLAVLREFGGIYVDFDSLWVDSVGKLNADPEWIPFTRRKLEGFPLIDGEGFLEGGVMKLQKLSVFSERALESFPKYTQEIARCWACVGPKHLTDVYIQMSQEDSDDLPTLVDSSLLYGDDYYRNNLEAMYSKVDFTVLSKAASTGSVAFHLFTSSGERYPKSASMIEFLFKVSDASGDSSIQHIPLGVLSQRRRAQENSVDYEVTDTLKFDADYDAEIKGKEDIFCTKWEEVVGTQCISVASGSVIVTHRGTPEQMQAAALQIHVDGGLDMSPEFRLFTLILPEEFSPTKMPTTMIPTSNPTTPVDEAGGDAKNPTNSLATTSGPADAQAATDGGDSGSPMETIMLVFIGLAGLLVVLGFYCIYRVWSGPGKSKKLKHLTDNHVQYIQNETRHSKTKPMPINGKGTFTPTPYQPPHNFHEHPQNQLQEEKRQPVSSSWEGGYQKREPQSSYIKDENDGYLVDEDEEVYGYGVVNHGYGGSHSNAAYYDYDNGVIHQEAVGGGYTDDAFYGGHGHDKRQPDRMRML